VSTRPGVSGARRVVLKLGTRVLTDDGGALAPGRITAVALTAARLHASGADVLIVTSGAVGLGRARLGLAGELLLHDRQACAAVGQGMLMELYATGLAAHGLTAAQLLLTESDFDDRVRYLNLRATLEALLGHGAVPIINENDAVSTEELAFVGDEGRPVFGDNDRLSALVASKLDADLLVLLTDVDGVYDRDPRLDATATLLNTAPASLAAGPSSSGAGRGGMKSKIESARIAAAAGCHAVIASGRDAEALPSVLRGEAVGTWFPAERAVDARRRWIAFAAAPRGVLHLDEGAVRAVRDRGASLLAVGVRSVQGTFDAGDVVELRAPDGALVGRGMVWCDSGAAARWVGGEPPERARNHHALVHRDQLALQPGASND